MAVFPDESVAVQPISVSPIGNTEPDAGTQITGISPSTLSHADASYSCTEPSGPVASLTASGGRCSSGGVTSVTSITPLPSESTSLDAPAPEVPCATPLNASKKVLWIEEHLPYISEVITVIKNGNNGVGKGRIHMIEKNSIFIDDHPSNLISTKAEHKYLFKYKETESDYMRSEIERYMRVHECPRCHGKRLKGSRS